MAIDYCWGDDQKRYFLLTYHKGWTWDDFDRAIDFVAAEGKTVEYSFAVVMDQREAPYPPNPAALGHFLRARDILPPTMGRMIIVGGAGFLRAVANTFDRVVGGTTMPINVETLEEGLAVIDQRESQ
jgi:hypothetical protein